MRTIAAIAMAGLLLSACGGDDDDNGGGGGGVNDVRLTGPLAATLTNGTSKVVSGTCSTDLGTLGFGGALVVVSTAPNLCAAIAAGREPANATSLLVTIVKMSLTGVATSVGAGTYPLWDFVGLPPLDAQGNPAYAFISANKSGGVVTGQPDCAVLGAGSATTGSVTITSASASSVSGTVTASLDDGSSV